MSIFDYFRSKNRDTASLAKERLQIIVAHERSDRTQPDYLSRMQRDIVDVIRKYVAISTQDVSVSLDQNDNCSILELNITLPDFVQAQQSA
jgi:cell division topological specificity factor